MDTDCHAERRRLLRPRERIVSVGTPGARSDVACRRLMMRKICRSRNSTKASSCERHRHPTRPRPQVVRRLRRGRARQLRHRAGRVLRHARPVGLRQDDDAEDDRRVRAADVGQGAAQRRRRQPRAAVQAQRQHGLPAVRAVPAHDGCRQRPVRAEVEEDRRRASTSPTSPRCSTSSASRSSPTASRRSCRAASSSAWHWHERWSTSRARCCSTSRSPRST